MDHLLPTANGRRHGRNSWTPEYALSDTKYAVRYRSTGNIFNLRDYKVRYFNINSLFLVHSIHAFDE